MATRQWTLEQRKQQAEKIKLWQPWKSSTGAKTLQGKAISSRNAFKGGYYLELKELRKLLKKQKEHMESL